MNFEKQNLDDLMRPWSFESLKPDRQRSSSLFHNLNGSIDLHKINNVCHIIARVNR